MCSPGREKYWIRKHFFCFVLFLKSVTLFINRHKSTCPQVQGTSKIKEGIRKYFNLIDAGETIRLSYNNGSCAELGFSPAAVCMYSGHSHIIRLLEETMCRMPKALKPDSHSNWLPDETETTFRIPKALKPEE